jgi:hypothetical protein
MCVCVVLHRSPYFYTLTYTYIVMVGEMAKASTPTGPGAMDTGMRCSVMCSVV